MVNILEIEKCWLKWMVQKTMYVVQLQCFGRCFLAKRRVDERRRKRIEMLDVMGDVEQPQFQCQFDFLLLFA